MEVRVSVHAFFVEPHVVDCAVGLSQLAPESGRRDFHSLELELRSSFVPASQRDEAFGFGFNDSVHEFRPFSWSAYFARPLSTAGRDVPRFLVGDLIASRRSCQRAGPGCSVVGRTGGADGCGSLGQDQGKKPWSKGGLAGGPGWFQGRRPTARGGVGASLRSTRHDLR